MIRGRRRPRGMGGEEDSLGLRVTWKTDRLDVHPTPIARPNHRTTGSSAPSPSRPSHLPGDGGGLSIWEGPFLGFGRVGQEVPVEDVRRRRSRGGEDLPEKLRVGAQGQRPPVWFPRIRDAARRGGPGIMTMPALVAGPRFGNRNRLLGTCVNTASVASPGLLHPRCVAKSLICLKQTTTSCALRGAQDPSAMLGPDTHTGS